MKNITTCVNFFKKLNYFFRDTPPHENEEADNQQTSSQSPIQPASDEGDQPSQPSVQPPSEQPDEPFQPAVQDTSEPADHPHPQALSQASQPVIRKTVKTETWINASFKMKKSCLLLAKYLANVSNRMKYFFKSIIIHLGHFITKKLQLKIVKQLSLFLPPTPKPFLNVSKDYLHIVFYLYLSINNYP